MYIINKTSNLNKPDVIESLNNGFYYYNFNITQEDIDGLMLYYYSYVRISGTPNLSKCYEAVLKEYKNKNGISVYDLLNLKDEDAINFAKEVYQIILLDLGILTDLEVLKSRIISQIDIYDSSDEVNSFILNGNKVWLDKATRVGLMNSLTIEKNSGKEISILWFNNTKLEIDINLAINMLRVIELYALNCYNITAEHKRNISNFTNIEDINNYNYKSGYPDKPSFTWQKI